MLGVSDKSAGVTCVTQHLGPLVGAPARWTNKGGVIANIKSRSGDWESNYYTSPNNYIFDQEQFYFVSEHFL